MLGINFTKARDQFWINRDYNQYTLYINIRWELFSDIRECDCRQFVHTVTVRHIAKFHHGCHSWQRLFVGIGRFKFECFAQSHTIYLPQNRTNEFKGLISGMAGQPNAGNGDGCRRGRGFSSS